MRRFHERPLFRSLLSAALTLTALVMLPEESRAESEDGCYSTCLWYCPEDKHSYCQTMGGNRCGFSATCEAGPCGALQIQLNCTGLPN